MMSMLLLAGGRGKGDKQRRGQDARDFLSIRTKVMRDHYDARLWNDGHEEVHASVDRLLRRIMQAFHVLHRIHWAAPWTDQRGSCGR